MFQGVQLASDKLSIFLFFFPLVELNVVLKAFNSKSNFCAQMFDVFI